MFLSLGWLNRYKLGLSIIKVVRFLNRKIIKLKHPLLILHGDKNVYTKTKVVKNFVRNLKCSDISTKILCDGYHELLLDHEKFFVYDKILEWIKTHIKEERTHRNFKTFRFKHSVNYNERVKISRVIFYLLLYFGAVVLLVD